MSKFSDLPMSEQRALIEQARKEGKTSISDIISAYDLENSEDSAGTSSPVLPFSLENHYKGGGRIHIKPQNRGKFTALKKRTGHSASWFKAHGTPAQKKMAVFALNARKWKHGDGGPLKETDPEFVGPPAPRDFEGNLLDYAEMKRRQRYAESAFDDSSVSRAGAVGRYQVMPITLKEYEQRTGNTGDLLDPEFNEALRDWYMTENLKRYNAIKRGSPIPFVDAYRRYVAYNEGPVALNAQLSQAEKDGVDINNTLDWLSYVYPEARDYSDFIVGGKDIPNTSKTNKEYEKAKKTYNIKGFGGNIFAEGTPEYQTSEGFKYVPEIQDEIVETPKINLSKGWRFNRGYYDQMVEDIMTGNDPLITRQNYNDIYFSGKRRAGKKLKQAIAKEDKKRIKDETEARLQWAEKQYKNDVIQGLREGTLTPEQFGAYTRYGIDKYGVPIAAPIVGGAVLGAATPVFGEVVGALGKYVPAAMDYSFNPVGAGLRTMIKNAPAAGATTVAGMSLPTASAVATGTDMLLTAKYANDALNNMKGEGVNARNATEFGMSALPAVIPAVGIPAMAAYRKVQPLLEEMPSFSSLFTTSSRVGGNGITPWQSYMARQALNPNSFYSRMRPEVGWKHYGRRLDAANSMVNSANKEKTSAENIRNDMIMALNGQVAHGFGSEVDAMGSMYAKRLYSNLPRERTLTTDVSTGGYSTEPLTYKTNSGNVVTADVPVFSDVGAESYIARNPEIDFTARVYSSGKPEIGATLVHQTRGYSDKPIGLNSPEREAVRQAVAADMQNLRNAAGNKGVWGGSAALAEKYGVVSPGDADLITTEKYWPELASELGFKHKETNALGAPKGEIKYSINGNNIIDADILEAVPGDPTKSKGKLANEFYALLHPDEYVKLRNTRAIDSLSGKAGELELPISPEDLLAEIQASPDIILKKTVMDNIVSGKFKHISRMKSMIDFDPVMMSQVIEDVNKSLYGERLPFGELYPNMKFDNVAANKEFLSALHLPDSWADNPEKMRVAAELLDSSLQSVTAGRKDILARSSTYKETPKQWVERLVDSGTSATNGAGAGANAVTGSRIGADDIFSSNGLLTVHRTRASFDESRMTTPNDLYKAFRKQTKQDVPITEYFTQDQLDKADKIVTNYLGHGWSDFKDVKTQEQLYAEINSIQDDLNALGMETSSQAMKEIAEALDMPAVRSAKDYFRFNTRNGGSIERGGYVGSFGSAKTKDGKPIYGMEVSNFDYNGEIETPRIFTNADLYPKSATAVNETLPFQAQEQTAADLKALFDTKMPDATPQVRNGFFSYIDELEKNFTSIRASVEKAVKDLQAAGVDIDKVGFDKTSAEWQALSEDAKALIDNIDIFDPDGPSVSDVISAIQHWKKFEDFSDVARAAEGKAFRATEYGNKVIKRRSPYTGLKNNKADKLRWAVISAMVGVPAAGAGIGLREISDRNYYRDDAYTSYVRERDREENPYPEYLIETFGKGAKTREERKSPEYKEMVKRRRREYMVWSKKDNAINREAKREYSSIRKTSREYEKETKKK